MKTPNIRCGHFALSREFDVNLIRGTGLAMVCCSVVCPSGEARPAFLPEGDGKVRRKTMWRLQLITGFLIGLLGLSGSVAWAAPSLAITATFSDATESPSLSTDNPARVTASNCALGLEGR